MFLNSQFEGDILVISFILFLPIKYILLELTVLYSHIHIKVEFSRRFSDVILRYMTFIRAQIIIVPSVSFVENKISNWMGLGLVTCVMVI